MNMIRKQRLANRGGHRGFTLVEVIVVLVILAILAAIAIPALTGYIDKVEDKKYIAQARNAAVAMRAVLDEAYADGILGIGKKTTDIDYNYYFKSGLFGNELDTTKGASSKEVGNKLDTTSYDPNAGYIVYHLVWDL
jgi:prepilin-type N-terminal cleavage/methylation domain-containing protein